LRRLTAWRNWSLVGRPSSCPNADEILDSSATYCHRSQVRLSRREARLAHAVAAGLDNLGIALQEVRRFHEAITAHQGAAAIYGETGDRRYPCLGATRVTEGQ
jgi:hypothetical protein